MGRVFIVVFIFIGFCSKDILLGAFCIAIGCIGQLWFGLV